MKEKYEIDLIRQIRQDDQHAFKKIYEIYCDKVYSFIKLYIVSPSDVYDIAQDVFVKLWENRANLDESKSLNGFLFILTRNTIFNFSRKNYHTNFVRMAEAEIAEDKFTSIEDQIETDDLEKYIDQLISLLPPRQKEVFILSRKQQLKNKEIAGQLNITEKAVERNITFAVKFLKKHLKLYVLFLLATTIS